MTVSDKTLTLRKIYEYASERGQFVHFHILNLLLPSIFCWYWWYFISETYIFSGLKLQSAWYIYHQMQFPVITYGMVLYIQTTVYRQNTDIEKIYEYASECVASELGKFLHFHILKLLFPSLVLLILYLRNIIFSGLKLKSAWYLISSMQFPVITYGMALYIQKTVYRQNNNIEKIYEYASERRTSELGKCLHFHILKLLFPSIFCWYFWYFMSETYIFSGLKLQSESAWYIIISSMQFPVLTYDIQTTVYRQNTDNDQIYVYASERA